MPLSPQDYLMNVPSPAQGVMGGVMQGLSLANIMEQRELGKQRAAREEQLFGQQMAAGEQAIRAQRQAMALRTRQAEQQRQSALVLRADLSNLATMEAPSAKDYNSLLLKHPQMAKTLQQSFEMMGEGEKKRITNDSIQIYSALENNRPDLAENILSEKLTAAENAGLDKQVATLKSTLATLKASPEAAKTTAGLMLSSSLGADKFATQFQKLREAAKTEVQIEAVEQELKEEKKTGFQDPLKKFDAEKKLRDEYVKNTQVFVKTQDAYRRLEASEETAAGDIALIFNYMKMLDPGSTVREGEFATAQNAAGVEERVVNMYNNIMEGERLNPGQRKMFKSQSSKILESAQKREKEVRSGINKVVKSYGLDKENIFYTEEEKPEVPTKEWQTTTTGIKFRRKQ